MIQAVKKTTKEILKANQKRISPLKSEFTLWAHDIRSLHNVGSLFRTADAFGVHELLLSGFTPVPPRPEITKTAIGAEECVSWRRVPSPETEAERLKKRGYLLLGLEQTHSSELITGCSIDSGKICLIIGNEVTGIDSGLLTSIDRFIEIPQFGMKHSLNVSVAAGVALYAFLDKLS